MTRKGSQVQVLYGPPRFTCEYRTFRPVRHAYVHRNWGTVWGVWGEIECGSAPSQLRTPQLELPHALFCVALGPTRVTSWPEALRSPEHAQVVRNSGRSSICRGASVR